MQLAVHLHRCPQWEVTIAVLEREPGAGASRLPSDLRVRSVRASNALASLFALRRLVKAHDVAYSWLDIANVMTTLAAAFTRTPVVWALRGSGAELSWLARTAAEMARPLNRFAAAIIANSERGREYFAGRGYRRSSISVVPNGVDTERFRPRAGAASDAFGFEAGTNLVGMVARFHPVKRHTLLLQAFADALEQRGDDCWRLVLVGPGVTEANAELRAVIDRRMLEGKVLLLGARDDLEQLYPQWAFAVCTSEHEGSPNSVLEALASGVPVLSTPVGDLPSAMTGAGLIAGYDRQALTAGLLEMMRMPAEARVRMGQCGRGLVEREFSLESSISKTLTVLSRSAERAA